MTTTLNERRFTKRKALLTLFVGCGLLTLCVLGLDAQVVIKDKDDKGDKAATKKDEAPRNSIEVSGYTRPGNPDDKIVDGKIVPVSFAGANVQKFKIMGGTVYFSVFKNTGLADGDTFGTGMANIDAKFEMGRSFKDSMSPRFDKKAKYLYLYQVVNDRNLGVTQVKGEKKDGGIVYPVVDAKKIDPKAQVPVAEDLASFSLKLLADPTYITSWGHFRDAGFAANVVDTDANGKPVKTVAANQKEVAKDIRLAFSYLPAIETKIPEPRFQRRARSHSLGELEAGFGVDKSNVNLKNSKAYGEIKKVVGELGKDNAKWINFYDGLLEAADPGREPEYVQLMYDRYEARAPVTTIIPGGVPDVLEDDVTRAIFRVDWDRNRSLKQGEHSVVFGFTTDLPPVTAPIRIDTPRGAQASEGMRFASYFSEEVVGRGTAEASGIALTAAGGAENALALSLGTSLGQAPTPGPAAGPAGGGFAGITGGFSSLGSQPAGGGGMGGGGMGWAPPFSGVGGGGFGGGGIEGGIGGGTGGTGGSFGGTNTGTNTPTQQQIINFKASLTNQQQQQQQQGQFQNQHQGQHQSGHGEHNHNHHHHGQVVPAPASLFLALLGLPGLWLLRRRKMDDAPAIA